ncbi:hypothetical protein LTR91_025110 [Friedmanniomyces endolithicus]|uniref:Uncharacterized protein n=1 Tax=Friedmanniomyces endolithicus TaxID=329885 RepID=A0AAN6H1I4_9PEZI|nr:hypothetical protein LTR02_015371 [Friedmanniomyces endolithicus]KAK0890938.1 hypothetical protein LTR57_024960 [Friedmanniomyces endolithicus]KAK0951245.1 hypothetical protein LTR91_025110 [Friedmanniomyces endolithicus]KAK0952203.1 hypothetical protein LTS01_024928 [Friedmanniomyces endolithicus]KAK1021941.1 hypothetical protein LTS16_026122 [Friedmanniomyces endolithicus]
MVGATVVLTNGSIKQASESENPDLFWGLLGVGQTSASQPISTCKPSLRRKCASVPYSSCPTPETVNKLVATINELHEVKQTLSGPQSKNQGRTMSLVALTKPPTAGGQT